MTRSELNAYRKTLQQMVSRLEQHRAQDQRELLRVEEPQVGGGSMPSTEDEYDGGLHEVQIGLIANETHLLNEVIAALDRIDLGSFGDCETCGKALSHARLDALPYARHCIRCARVSEKA